MIVRLGSLKSSKYSPNSGGGVTAMILAVV